ncbi:MAG: endonuclease domain-containing protein [Candidatus Fimenecus sp.]
MLKYNKDLIAYAKELRKNMTPWENKLWNWFLRDYPIRFQRQKVIDNYIVDFYCAKARLVIELDGGGHYTGEQMQYDANRTEILEKYGLKILRICNLEIDNNFYNVCEYIDREVKQSLPQSPDGDSPLVRGGK